MTGHNDNLLALRIMHQLREHHLDTRAICIIEDSKNVHQLFNDYPSCLAALTSDVIGIPVAAVVDSDDKWILIGTASIICKDAGVEQVVNIDHMRACDSPSVMVLEKGHHEYLRVAGDNDLNMLIWASVGNVYYAVWNILLMLIRMNKTRPPAS